MEEYKYIEWVGSSKNDLKKFPAYVKDQVGFALYQAQMGLKHRNVKSLRNIGSNVLEIVSRYDGNTYRVVYTVQFSSGGLFMYYILSRRRPREVYRHQSRISI